MKNYAFILLCFLATSSNAAPRYFASGLLASFENEKPAVRGEGEGAAVSAFLKEYFGHASSDFEWRQSRVFRDKTHAHFTFALYYRGYRVIDQSLHLDYNRAGFVEYATSNWKEEFEADVVALTSGARWWVESALKAPYFERDGFFRGSVSSEPCLWIDTRNGKPVAALAVRFFPSARAGQWRYFIAHAESGRVLSERPVSRNVDIASKAWVVSPYNGGSNVGAPSDVTLTGLDATNSLTNGFFKVRRMENVTTAALSPVSPDLTTPCTFDPTPDLYDYECTGSVTDCPNQRIDAINVYYNLHKYRTKLATYFTTLGLDIPMVAPHSAGTTREPLEVYINAFGLNTDGDGNVENEANNAGFYPYGCGRVAGVDVPRCLIFMRPRSVTSAECGSDKAFYDLAREAMVIVHEYQHFVTDSIVDLVPGSYDTSINAILHNVGDAVHEGYSDYFGASIVTENAGTSTTKIGEYAFQNCSYYQRDVDTLRVYTNGDAERDAHVAGLSWASGLWQLRKELGQTTADLLTMKSIFFLSENVGFAETVEALVKADKALNGGANVARIRTLFYEDIAWGSREGNVFRDASAGIVEVGFRSCSSGGAPIAGQATLALAALWLGLLWAIGRARFVRGEKQA